MEPRAPPKNFSIPLQDFKISSFDVMIVGFLVLSLGAYSINSVYSTITCSTICIMGSMIALLGFMGWFGTRIEHVGLVNVQVCCLMFLFAIELVIVCLVYYSPTQTQEISSQLWDFFLTYDSRFIFDIENIFYCCGYSSVEDRAVPANCLLSTVSCQSRLTQDRFLYALLALLFYQCYDLILSLLAYRNLRKKINEEDRLFSFFHSQPSSEGTSSGYFGRSRKASFTPRYGTTPSTRSIYHP